MPLRKDDRRGDHRPCQRSAADLVDAGNALVTGEPQLPLVAHVSVARTPMLARTLRRRTTDPITRSVTASAALAQGGGLADAAAQEVELGAAGDTVADHLDLPTWARAP